MKNKNVLYIVIITVLSTLLVTVAGVLFYQISEKHRIEKNAYYNDILYIENYDMLGNISYDTDKSLLLVREKRDFDLTMDFDCDSAGIFAAYFNVYDYNYFRDIYPLPMESSKDRIHWTEYDGEDCTTVDYSLHQWCNMFFPPVPTFPLHEDDFYAYNRRYYTELKYYVVSPDSLVDFSGKTIENSYFGKAAIIDLDKKQIGQDTLISHVLVTPIAYQHLLQSESNNRSFFVLLCMKEFDGTWKNVMFYGDETAEKIIKYKPDIIKTYSGFPQSFQVPAEKNRKCHTRL